MTVELPLSPQRWEVFVPGRPAPKGSGVQWRDTEGRVMFKQSSAKHLRPWNNAIRYVTQASKPPTAYSGPVGVQMTFALERPKSNRDPFPMRRTHGDIDKLTRAVFDALVPHVLLDDSLVVRMAVIKRWAETRNGVGVWITVTPA
jgi:Holliday junction resolvase RusA-like endonuclease